MSEIYNEEYYRQYDVGIGKVNYQNSTYTKDFLTGIAKQIVSDFHPKTVLDAGCAMGHLVAALRDLGVEAYGVDVSEYAIANVREDIRPFCRTASLSEDFPADLPQHYDLVVTIEVLEHLYAEDGQKAIANLCRRADTVLFSSTPDDFEERTHVNVQQREYWARLFFKQGFTDDINYRPRYLTPYASLFRKNTDLVRQIEDYERNIRMTEDEYAKNAAYLNQAVQDKETHIQNLTITHDTECKAWNAQESEYIRVQQELENKNASQKKDLLTQEKEIKKIEQELAHYKEHYHAIVAQNAALERQLAEAQNAYNVISNAFFWKITKPARVIADWIKMPLRKVAVFRLMNKGLRCLRENGWRYTFNKLRLWSSAHKETCSLKTKDIPSAQKLSVVPENIKVSVVVPLYNTPEKFLREMIQSLQKQNYQNWELCLADGSDENHSEIGKVCNKFTAVDSRIKYSKLERNNGISENTNRAIEMATGEYIGFLDHDDILMPDAIYENVNAILNTDADVLYSDEDHLSLSGKHMFPFYKPDWSPDLLFCQMYVCHFMVVRRTLLDTVGHLRSEFNGSQDYDLLLRLSERTNRIYHIPKILYTWRESETSTAANADSKPYADGAGKQALDVHLKKVYGECAYVENTEYTFVYNARFKLPNETKVSIIIPMKDKWELSDQCIRSILTKSSYTNYEIIVLDNRSEEVRTKKWFKQIQQLDSRVKVIEADMEFNWSKLNNYGVSKATGDVFVFLNNDTLIISEDWMERLAENALRKDIGVVGGLLLYPDDTIQHAGVVVGMGGWADHVFKGMDPIHFGSPFVSPVLSRNVLAVTGACMAISRETWNQIGVFDEEFIICGSDVELCIRAYDRGLFNRYDANVKLYHLESKSRDSYIPEVDFKKSDVMYAPYRENGDPFYNVNLSKESVIPKELAEPMPSANFKNFLKKCPLIVSAYQSIKNKMIQPAEYSIPEIGSMHPTMTNIPFGKRLNLVVPSIDRQHVFGGIATALKIFECICEEMDCAARIITTDAEVKRETSVLSAKYKQVKSNEESSARYQVVSYSDRATAELTVAKEDYFVATAWWTAYIISDVMKWQSKVYSMEKKPLLYIIQDYEPGFYAWSSRYMMAESTYHLDASTYAIINSTELDVFLQSRQYQFEKSWVFDPVLNERLRKKLPDYSGSISKKKQIMVYGRPSVERNAFGILVAGLTKWSRLQKDAETWSVYSLGEQHDDIELAPNVVMHSMGKLSLDEYAQFLTDTYAGVSLMVSLHPSYPPLEMAAFGVKTITNKYENKNWKNFSTNIYALDKCTPDDIAEKLQQICNQFDGLGKPDAPSQYLDSDNGFYAIAQEVARKYSL